MAFKGIRGRGLGAVLALAVCGCRSDDKSDDTGAEVGESVSANDDSSEAGSGDEDAGVTGESETGGELDACALVDGQSFSSQMQLECGLGPDGVVLCNWTITFSGGDYDWFYSDISEMDDYGCEGLDLVRVPEGTVLGSVSADGLVLDWQGQLYDRS